MPATHPPVDTPQDRRMELGLMLSHTCNITCRHCGILSSPHNKNRMRMEDARRWIVEASHVPIVKHINFTGGEPFLFQDEHAELLALCRSLKLGARMVTNGFWARTVKDGLRVLGRMKDAGLTEINFSADVFHLEFLEPQTLRNALECARQLGFCRIVSFVSDFRQDPLDHFSALYGIPRDDLLPLIPAEIIPRLKDPQTAPAVKAKVLVYAGGLIGLGRAAEYPGDLRWFPLDELSDGCCLEVVNKPVIYPDGDLQACCCAGGKMSPFTIGNLHRERLDVLLDRMFARAQFQFINTNGPKALFKLVAAARPDLPKQDRYTSICEMCVRATDGLSAGELDEIVNDSHLKAVLDLFGAGLPEPSMTARPGAPRLLPLTPVNS